MAFTDYFDQFIAERHLTNETTFCLDDLYSWFDDRHPEVKHRYIVPQLLKKTTNRPARLKPGNYNPNASPVDDYFYATDAPVFNTIQRYQPGLHEPPYYPDCLVREHELRELFASDPTKIEPGLKLIRVEYPAGGATSICCAWMWQKIISRLN